MTCSSNVLALWTINGELLARTRIPTPGGGILSCCMSEVGTTSSLWNVINTDLLVLFTVFKFRTEYMYSLRYL